MKNVLRGFAVGAAASAFFNFIVWAMMSKDDNVWVAHPAWPLILPPIGLVFLAALIGLFDNGLDD